MPQKGCKHTEETKKKIGLSNSIKLKGKILPIEVRNKLSKSLKGHKVSENTRNKISTALTGIKRSEETKKKISNSQKGVKKIPMPSETKLRLSIAKKGKPGHPNPNKGGKRSDSVLQKISGSKCHFWKGGITPLNQKIRSSKEYKWWRTAIYRRDNFICQKCKVSGGVLVVHHINNFADFPELRTSISNGVTLCRHCHSVFHQIYGRRNNTKEQLSEYLINN